MHLQEGHLPQVPLLQGERGGVGRLSGAPEERLDRGAAEDAATDREDEEGGDEDERMPPGTASTMLTNCLKSSRACSASSCHPEAEDGAEGLRRRSANARGGVRTRRQPHDAPHTSNSSR